jgi:hypothetical protein
MMEPAVHNEIRGHLDGHWSAWFGGLRPAAMTGLRRHHREGGRPGGPARPARQGPRLGLELLEVRRTDRGVPHEFDFVAFTSVVARRVIADRVRALASL